MTSAYAYLVCCFVFQVQSSKIAVIGGENVAKVADEASTEGFLVAFAGRKIIIIIIFLVV